MDFASDSGDAAISSPDIIARQGYLSMRILDVPKTTGLIPWYAWYVLPNFTGFHGISPLGLGLKQSRSAELL
jgi:hypothetical protein